MLVMAYTSTRGIALADVVHYYYYNNSVVVVVTMDLKRGIEGSTGSKPPGNVQSRTNYRPHRQPNNTSKTDGASKA